MTSLSTHHPNEKDYWNHEVEVVNSQGQIKLIRAYLLRVYPTQFNNYDAYMDIPKIEDRDIKTVYSQNLNTKWEVVNSQESPIKGLFRGNQGSNNPPAWVFALKKQ